jgi:hypothetical protein
MACTSLRRVEYKTIVGSFAQIQQELSTLAPYKWKPMLITASPAPHGPLTITVVLEHISQDPPAAARPAA